LVYVSVSPSAMFEDAPGVMTFTIALDRPSTTDTVVTYTLAGTATRDTDYTTTATGIATIAAGAGGVTFTVDPTADSVFEPNETVVVGLVAVTAGSATLSPLASAATGTITNDDATAGRQERVGRAVYDAGTTITSFFSTANDGTDTVRWDFAPGRFVDLPRWSPDGRQIAFFDKSKPLPQQSVPDNVVALMVMNADGTNERQVAWATLGSLDWHPDSKHLLFVRSETSVTGARKGYFYVIDTATGLLTFSPSFVPLPLPIAVSLGDRVASQFVTNALWRNPGSTGWPQTVIYTTWTTTCDVFPVVQRICWYKSELSTLSFGLSAVGTPIDHPLSANINLLHHAFPVPPGADRTNTRLINVSINGEVIVYQTSYQRVGALPTQEQGIIDGERLILYTTETPTSNNAGMPSLQIDYTILPFGATDFSPDGKKIRYLNAIFNWQTYLAEVKSGAVTNGSYLGLHPAGQLPMHWYLAP
jgi:WD40-like Beta Propeller Repeat